MGDHDYAEDGKRPFGFEYLLTKEKSVTERSPLENSMVQEITIPMSLTDFARRERFRLAFGLMVEAVENIDKSLQAQKQFMSTSAPSQDGWAASKVKQAEIGISIQTLKSILNKIKEDDE